MKSIKIVAIVMIALSLISCEAIQKATNTTGSAFSLTGQWELTGNTPDAVIAGVGTKVTVAPIVSEGRITTLVAGANCLRQNDIIWKTIAADNTGGFKISTLVNGCNGLAYQPAIITVMSNTEIKVAGEDNGGKDFTQLWKRIK